jgi:hypothetical protein
VYSISTKLKISAGMCVLTIFSVIHMAGEFQTNGAVLNIST